MSGPFDEVLAIARLTLAVSGLALGISAVLGIPVGAWLGLQINSLGATGRQQARALLAQARGGVIAALLAAFGGIISEVGAAMLVVGNIEGRTRVLSTAIVLETRRGDFGLALALGGVLLLLAFIVNVGLLKLQATPRHPT